MLADNGGSFGAPRALGSYNTPKPSAPTSSSTGGGGGQRSSTSSGGPSSSKGPSNAKQRDSAMDVAKWVTNSDLGQTLMMGCGFIPILGSLCAGAEAAAYAAQGRWGEAAFSAAGIAAGVVVGASAAVASAKVAIRLTARAAKVANPIPSRISRVIPASIES